MQHVATKIADVHYYYHLLVKAYHRLNCSSSTVLTATCLSYGSLAWLSDFFPISTLEAPTDIHAKWLKWRGCTQGCAFCRNKRYFSYPLNSRPYSSTFRCFNSRIFNVLSSVPTGRKLFVFLAKSWFIRSLLGGGTTVPMTWLLHDLVPYYLTSDFGQSARIRKPNFCFRLTL